MPLKQLCANLLDVSIDELNVLKRNNTPIDITVGKDWVDIIHEETHSEQDYVFESNDCMQHNMYSVIKMISA